ncbi:MAG: Fic family protein [Zoogloeaceae bacterium]|jgi:cell filamentation protein|nr:Fic family protein [Zoogloeaceae bacterium]
MQYTENELLESDLTRRRIRQLQDNPIQGKYDIAHLKETHRYIFQDLPKAGLWDYDVQPGEFRQEASGWHKGRVLESLRGADGNPPDVSMSVYSRMDSKAIAKLRTVLEGAKPENFKVLDKKAFAEKISTLYHDLDYLHPFREGNSRTLRTFTEQIAREAGYKMNWQNLNSQANRDLLFIARDRGLTERALRDKDWHTEEKDIARYDANRHRIYPNLSQLLEKTVEKIR